jgi:hypothetical protein
VDGHPEYEVSSLGRVRSFKSGEEKILKPEIDRHGYCRVVFSYGRVRVRRLVHQLVLEAFVSPRPSPKHLTAHGDANRANNVVNNLRWATLQDNADDRVRHGNSPRGEKHADAVLTKADVIRIRTVDTPSRVLAKEYGVRHSTILRARKGKTWGWLEA